MSKEQLTGPLVSVVMSVYNDAHQVSGAVDSIRGQTFDNWEFIVIDDGSTDDTAKILARAADDDPRIRVVTQPNRGLTLALIRGCQEARGTFIARQDADDYSMPERFENQVALLHSDSEIGFVSCATRYVGPQDEPLETLRRPQDSVLATRQLLEHRKGPPAHGSVMFRKVLYDQVGGYRPQFYFGQDADLWLRMAERARVAYCDEALYIYRRSVGAISGALRPIQQRFGKFGQACRVARDSGVSEEEALSAAEQLSAQLRNGEMARTPGRRAAADAAYAIGSQLVVNRDRRARVYLRQTLRNCPWHGKAWIRLLQSTLTVSG